MNLDRVVEVGDGPLAGAVVVDGVGDTLADDDATRDDVTVGVTVTVLVRAACGSPEEQPVTPRSTAEQTSATPDARPALRGARHSAAILLDGSPVGPHARAPLRYGCLRKYDLPLAAMRPNSSLFSGLLIFTSSLVFGLASRATVQVKRVPVAVGSST